MLFKVGSAVTVECYICSSVACVCLVWLLLCKEKSLLSRFCNSDDCVLLIKYHKTFPWFCLCFCMSEVISSFKSLRAALLMFFV